MDKSCGMKKCYCENPQQTSGLTDRKQLKRMEEVKQNVSFALYWYLIKLTDDIEPRLVADDNTLISMVCNLLKLWDR